EKQHNHGDELKPGTPLYELGKVSNDGIRSRRQVNAQKFQDHAVGALPVQPSETNCEQEESERKEGEIHIRGYRERVGVHLCREQITQAQNETASDSLKQFAAPLGLL